MNAELAEMGMGMEREWCCVERGGGPYAGGMRHGVVVVAPMPRRGMVGLAFLLGGVVAAATLLLAPLLAVLLLFFLLSPLLGLLDFVFTGALVAVPAAACAAMLVNRVDTPSKILLLGGAYGLGMTGAMLVTAAFRPSDEMLYRAEFGVSHAGFLWYLLKQEMLAALMCIGTFVAVYLVFRWRGGKRIEQTGRLCWECGYDLGSEQVLNCPECGAMFATGRPKGRRSTKIIDPLARLSRWPAMIVFAAAATMVVWTAVAGVLPSPVRRALGPTSTEGLVYPSAGTPRQVYYIVHATAKKRALVAELEPNKSGWGTHLRLWIGEPTSILGAGQTSIVDLDPAVYAVLSPEQTKLALTEGVPEKLKEAVFEAGLGRTLFYAERDGTRRPDVVVDPTPFFAH